MTALASFPGSGNTWLRYLLQQVSNPPSSLSLIQFPSKIPSQATGISTGSVYKDFALLKNGFPMESVSNGSVLVVKTHKWGGGGRKPFDAAILLIRFLIHIINLNQHFLSVSCVKILHLGRSR